MYKVRGSVHHVFARDCACAQVMRRSVMPESAEREEPMTQEEPSPPPPRPATADAISDLVIPRSPKLQELKHTRRLQRKQRPPTIIFPRQRPASADLDLSMSVKAVPHQRR